MIIEALAIGPAARNLHTHWQWPPRRRDSSVARAPGPRRPMRQEQRDWAALGKFVTSRPPPPNRRDQLPAHFARCWPAPKVETNENSAYRARNAVIGDGWAVRDDGQANQHPCRSISTPEPSSGRGWRCGRDSPADTLNCTKIQAARMYPLHTIFPSIAHQRERANCNGNRKNDGAAAPCKLPGH